MPNNQLMSPRQVTSELGVVYQTVRHWVSGGKLTPVTRTVGGHARFDRADVDAIKFNRRSKKPASVSLVLPEESSTPVEPLAEAPPAAPEAEYDETKTVSLEIERAMLAAAYGRRLNEHLEELQEQAVLRITGLPKHELFFRVWNAPLAQVAAGMGFQKHVLVRICKLYDVPTPPKDYFQTSIARRSVRVIRLPVAGASS